MAEIDTRCIILAAPLGAAGVRRAAVIDRTDLTRDQATLGDEVTILIAGPRYAARRATSNRC